MQGGQPKDLTPPGNLRPAQLGIVLVGRVILGHVTATLVDLAQRGFLRIEEVDGQADPSWLLTDLRTVDYLTGAFSIAVATTGGLCRGVGRRRLRRAAPTSLAGGQPRECLGDRPGGSGGLDHLVDGRLDCLGLAGALVG
jgi:hypothetical protein